MVQIDWLLHDITEYPNSDPQICGKGLALQCSSPPTLAHNMSLLLISLCSIPEEEARRKPSIRTLTVRYVLALLKYLHEGAKADMLTSRPLLFQHLIDDPSDVVNEILSIVEQHVLKDVELPRSAKAMILTPRNLDRVVEVATRSREGHPSAERAFAWLKAVCSTPSYGVLRPNGWYPPGTAKQDLQNERPDSAIDLGLDSLEFYDRAERPDVRNTTLLAWIQSLRQHDLKERELVLTCFTSAPELVAAYFGEKTMQLEPKLSNTWIGYASFLFEVTRLPSLKNLGNIEGDGFAELPPQTTIVLESILPRPLSQKVLTRCLNQSSELITFFAVRLLVLAFQKLSAIVSEMRSAAEVSVEHRSLWQEAAERLQAQFTERAPAMKDVISTFRKTPDDEEHALQREAVVRLLRLYYEVTPVEALEEQFDVSAALTAALARHDGSGSAIEVGELRALELQHLLVIAKHSPGMRWFSKQGALKYSPVVSLLRLHTKNAQDRAMRTLLWDVLRQHDLLAFRTELDALIGSVFHHINSASEESSEEELWAFIDECMSRATRQPVKYVDQLEAAVSQLSRRDDISDESSHNEALPGLLAAVVAEQAAFAVEKPVVVRWLVCFADLLCRVDGTTKATTNLRHQVLALPKCKKEAKRTRYDAESLLQTARLSEPDLTTVNAPKEDEPLATLSFQSPPVESDNHPELLRWAQKDLGVAIEDGDVEALMLCLCSKHSDIRRQAHAQLKLLSSRLRTSTLEDKDLLRVLIGELMETFEQQCLPDDKALPYLTGTFATRALQVLQEPTHCIYPKLSRYLIKSPEWRIHRMPSYWLSMTALSQPEEDDAYWKEVQWVLDWLVDGLRTESDLDILRRGGVFEKVTALYASPAGARQKGVREGVMEVLFRASCVEGGSNMLITRAGVLAWLDMVKTGDGDMAGLVRRRVLETCDGKRIRKWAGAKVEEV